MMGLDVKWHNYDVLFRPFLDKHNMVARAFMILMVFNLFA
jgi:hypothetical protein